MQDGRFQLTGSLNRSPDVLLTVLANWEAKHMMESHELVKYVSEMMGTQFTHPGIQHDSLYEVEYDHTFGTFQDATRHNDRTSLSAYTNST